MGVQLRGSVSVYGPSAVVLELGSDPFTSRFGWQITAKPGFNVLFHLAEGDGDALPMGISDSLITTH
jgi:hypothetical protein